MKSLLIALGFLTAIPVRTRAPAPGDLGRSGACFPFVGLVLGAVLLAAQAVLSGRFPPLLSATIIVALWAALTGALHLDGLADCADGLLATVTRERRLEILRDPRVGAFGVVSLTLFLLLKAQAVGALLGAGGDSPGSPRGWSATFHHFAPFVASTVFARWVVLVVARQPPARSSGSGADFSRGLGLRVFGVALVLPLLVVCAGVAAGKWTVLVAAVIAHAVAFGIIALARARIGGVTGDVLGLTIELAELAVLLTFVAGNAWVRG